ncbi:response regulator transcription factor [Ectopseudomonas alcaliphila]|uniref:Response regulator transcription factor n=1 Tax=Ectopseudomonas alcaliphila TaxID=101564 RepID=A0A1G6UFD0_9GAMM|nr:response regulator transcription factor [Pseudomonas alcaliphila]MDX5991520.1 response regulator transcription factor [Pseudomonas alcaliphila]PKM34480.1 MAG: DNA-binding response regulator [Gammaproteobacteria bacterium HGW-Gammaproteobacteria-12]SDD39416.1 two component transcriptional regulator, LuxR family [Pseudomonas alcaliphila]
MTCRVLLADDHAVIRAGVRAMIQDIEDYTIVGEAEDGKETVDLARELEPDIILLDISMKRVSGLEALQVLNRHSPDCKVLILSMHTGPEVVLEALQKGAHGYLLKDAAAIELRLALEAVRRGDRYLSSAIVQPVIEQAVSKVNAHSEHRLTQRQLEILRLITRGESTRSIANGLGLSVKTVEAHRAQIMKRLQIHDVPSLVLYAVREGIISPDD